MARLWLSDASPVPPALQPSDYDHYAPPSVPCCAVCEGLLPDRHLMVQIVGQRPLATCSECCAMGTVLRYEGC